MSSEPQRDTAHSRSSADVPAIDAASTQPALQETNVVAAASDGPAAVDGERDVVNDAPADAATPDAAANAAAAEAGITDTATPSATAAAVTARRSRATLNEKDAFAEALAERTAAAVATPPEPRTTGEGWLHDLFPPNWKGFLGADAITSALTDVEKKLNAKRDAFHPVKDIFNAFWACEPEEVKVVFLALDPAPQPEKANGLALSCPTNEEYGLSIKCFLAELCRNGENLNIMLPDHADHLCWARQGVLLLNTYLTLRTRETPQENTSGSHKEVWTSCVPVGNEKMDFTSFVLKRIAEKNPHVAFVAFGNEAVEACTVVRTMPDTVMRSWITKDKQWLTKLVKINDIEVDAIMQRKPPKKISYDLLCSLSYGLKKSLNSCGALDGLRLFKTKVPKADMQRLVEECSCLRREKAWYGVNLGAAEEKMKTIRKTTLAVYWLDVLMREPQGKILNAAFVECLPGALQQKLERHGNKGEDGKITITTENFSEDLKTDLRSLIKENPDICEGNRTGEEGAIAGRHLLLLGRHPATGLTIPRWRQQVNAFLSSRLHATATVDWSIVSREEAKRNWAAFIVKRNKFIEENRNVRLGSFDRRRVANEQNFLPFNS